MCGISAVFLKKSIGKIDPSIFNDLMHHRGKDGFGYFSTDQIFLSVSMHTVIGSGKALQPYSSASGRFILIGNGDVYNYREIAEQLGLNRQEEINSYDLAVALRAFEQYGHRAFSMFRGPFAIAIWDDFKKELWIAKDHLGERTIYCFEDSDYCFFSSEINIIDKFLTQAGRKLSVSTTEALKFIGLGRIAFGPETLLNGVKEIPRGLILNVSSSGIKEIPITDEYHDPGFESQNENVNFLLRQSLDRVFRTDAKVSLAFSGGVDSTFILDHILKKGLDISYLITLYSPLQSKEDENLIRSKSIADYAGIKIDYIPFQIPPFVEVVDILTHHFDGPVSEPIALHNHCLHTYAGSQSKVLIGGHGGDEVFAGYERCARVLMQTQGMLFTHPVSQLFASASRLDWEKLSRVSNFSNFMKRVLKPEARDVTSEIANHMENSALGWRIGNFSSIAQFLDLFFMQHYENFRIPDENGISRGVEVRSPFFDWDLINYVLSLSPEAQLKDGKKKQLLRNSFWDKNLLRFLNGPKVGFDDFFAYRKWMLKNRKQLVNYTKESPLRFMNLLNDNLLKSMLNNAKYFEQNWRFFWRLFALSVWLNKRP